MKLYLFENAIHKPTGIPLPGYLIITDDNKNILIDTGVTPHDAELLKKDTGIDFEIGESRLPLNILKSMDISPNDIYAIINTHFHFDHCGYNRSFPNAIFYVQKSHYEYVKKSNDKMFGYSDRPWDDPSINYQLVDGDKEILPGIHVIRTDGHEPGIQSVKLNLKNSGNVLIASDAISDSRMLTVDNNPAQYSMFNRDPELVNKGVIKLKKIIKDQDMKLIIFSHDAETWPTYKKIPDFYD